MVEIIPIFRSPNYNDKNSYFGLEGPRRKLLFKLNANNSGCVCEEFKIIPHVHGTHIENASHVSNLKFKMSNSLCLPLTTMIVGNDEFSEKVYENVQFLILKNLTQGAGYDLWAITNIFSAFPNLIILGTQEPSFDPVNDGGSLAFHRKYLEYRPNNLLVELLNLTDESIECNVPYQCLLNPYFIADTDAIPCSPVLLREPGPSLSISSNVMALSESCLFCKIIRGVIPSFKIYETSHTFAFMDINPLSEGHILIIPKFHGARLHEIDDAHLADLLPVAKKILVEGFGEKGAKLIPDYNILQNNGRLAHQEVDHVHFHIIPKRNETEGLGIKWSSQKANMEQLGQLAESIRAKLA